MCVCVRERERMLEREFERERERECVWVCVCERVYVCVEPLNLSTGHFKIRFGLQPVPRYDLSTYQPSTQSINHCIIVAGR